MPGERFEREAKNAPHLFFSAGCRRRGVDPRTCIERSAFGAATTARTDAAQVFGVVLAAAVAFVVSDEVPDTTGMDLRDSPDGGRAARARREVRSMAGLGFMIVVMLILVLVPVWALIWGRKVPPATREPPSRLRT
jgi:hypothetical protein